MKASLTNIVRSFRWFIIVSVSLVMAFSAQAALVRTSLAASTNYYVDSVSGSDSNSGASEAAPWKTLSKVNSKTFQPGDVVHFKRGSTWTGTLTINSSGAAGNPITFTAYGSGAAPTITYPGGDINHKYRGILIYSNWVIVENFLVIDVFDDGIGLWNNASNNIIRYNEINDAGRGITIEGQNNLITHNYIHDLHMVLNDGANPYDDYGASAINFYSSYNEVSYNRIENCKAPSIDYGTDGGAFEWWGTTDGNYVHHNWAKNNNGFAEVGGGSAHDTLIAYNVSINNGKFSSIHTNGDSMGSDISNYRVENNTIVEQPSEMQYTLIWFGGDPTPSTFFLRNNLFYVNNYYYLSDADRQGWSFVHENNLYHFPNSTTKVGFTMTASEKKVNPQFANLSGEDFHLQPGSPAIDSAVDMAHQADFDENPVPVGSGPDIGAYEYQSGGSAPTETPAPTPTETPEPTGTPPAGNTPPSINGVSPDRSPIHRSVMVTITGEGFQPGVAVFFGQIPCQNVQYASENQISCSIPSEPSLLSLESPVEGSAVYPVDVTITNPDLQSYVLVDGFRFEMTGQSAVYVPALFMDIQ